jgi:uncharacterized protein CbrC (UPF0167 family)
MGIFHFHKWIYGDNIRMCSTCGKKQVYWANYNGSGWMDAEKPDPLCPTCRGRGEVLDHQFNVVPCPFCNPNHDIPQLL